MAIQATVNYRNKSTVGYSTDFSLIAFLGFVMLLTNQTVGLVDPYSDAGRVHVVDEIAATFYLAISASQLVQTTIYPRDKPMQFTIISWAFIMAVFVLGGLAEGYLGIMMKSYLGISWIVYCALGKALSTLLKYFMQAFHNYKRKAVTGASPLAFAADLTGASLALIQMQIDSIVAGEGFFLFDPRMNLAKFLLCFFSGSFDAVILVQYFFLYSKASRTPKE